MDNNGIQATPNLVRAILAPILQPGAQLGLTGQETQTSQQSQQTGQAEQANLQASNPGIQAQSQTQQVQATQNVANLAAGNAIKNGMSLGGAIKTFGALGVKPDDVFQKYLSSSPNGFPKESLNQLKNMGISDSALGKVGDLSSFADRQNMRNAVEELRSLQDTFNNTGALAKVPVVGTSLGSGKIYEGQRQLVGQHLSSLIQGAPQASGSVNDLMSAIPNAGDLSQLQPGEANQMFTKAEQTLLKSKGYTYKDLGLSQPEETQKSITGGNILTGIMGGILNPQIEAANKAMANASTASKENVNPVQKAIDMTAGMGGGVLSALPSDISNALTIEGARAIPGALSKSMDFLNPGRVISNAGNARDALTEMATKEGKTLDGTKIFNDLSSQLKNAMGGNLGQSKALNAAISDAKNVFKGKQFTPTQLDQMYKEADSGYTKFGIPKSPIQANIDRGLRNVLKGHLNDQVPGWQEATAKMAKGYTSKENPIRKGTVNALKYAPALAVGGAAGDLLKTIFGSL